MFRKNRNLTVLVALLGSAALALSACSSSGTAAASNSGSTAPASTSSSSSSSSSTSAPPSSADTAQLAVQAAAEGSVSWYTTFVAAQIPDVVKAFNKVYPKVKVVPLRLSSDKLPPKVEAEQSGHKYTADVITGDAPQISQLLNAGALQQFDAPDAPPLPAGLSIPAGYRNIAYINTTVIAYDPAALKREGLIAPTSLEDLTKPGWKGNFSIDPGAVNLFQSLISTMGHTNALALMKKLGDNDPKLVESHTLALTQVQSGEPAATATAYGYLASATKAKSSSDFDFVNPNPLPVSLNLIDMAKNAPHPAAAKLFITWFMSEQGQKAIADITSHTSIRSDVPADPTVWNPSKWKPAWADPNPSSSTYNQYTKEMASALHALS